MTSPISQRDQRPTATLCALLITTVLAFGIGPARAQSDRQTPPPDFDRGYDRPPADLDREDFSPPERNRQRRGGPRGGATPRAWTSMSPEEKAELLAFIEEHFPKLFMQLERLETRQPERHAMRMGRIASEMRHLLEVMKADPQRGHLLIKERRLDMETRFLAARYRHAQNDEDRDKIREAMRALCEELFDVRLERRELEIRDLEARIDDLRNRQQHAADMRNELIDREINDRLTRPMGPGRGEGHFRGRPGPPDDDR